jgi:hypothetical protein
VKADRFAADKYVLANASGMLGDPEGRGAVLACAAIRRFALTKSLGKTRDGRRLARPGQILLGACLGAFRDTIARWTDRAAHEGRLRVHTRGHRLRLFYEVEPDRPNFDETIAEMTAITRASGSSEALRKLLVQYPRPNPEPPPPGTRYAR